MKLHQMINIFKQTPKDSQDVLLLLENGKFVVGYLIENTWYRSNSGSMWDKKLNTVISWIDLPK